jgi:DNA-binding transcriptional ArsR family regulator
LIVTVAKPVAKASAKPVARPDSVKAREAAAERRLKLARKASTLLKYASDATRLQIILILAGGEHHVGALCDLLGLGQPAVSHHLVLLRLGGIVAVRREGKKIFYALNETGERLAKIVGQLAGGCRP